jgi:NAD(P)-dependent dehydrogenase (short-subunit alcohol dehydrogenase family)
MQDTSDVFALVKDLRVLVTAGASGIRRAISSLLAARGTRLHICDVSDDFLAEYRDARVTAEDVAATVAYLLSPAGHNVSGQSLGVDGNVEAL